MAVLAYFHKISEQDGTVAYRVGSSPEDLSKVLSLDTETRRVLPGDDPVTHQLLAAARKIVRLQTEAGTWPEKGMTAS